MKIKLKCALEYFIPFMLLSILILYIIHRYFIHEYFVLWRFNSPIFTMPWLVSSQHDWSLSVDRLLDCLDEKNPNAASVTWYACNVNSLRAGSICATAPTASSATFMQSLRVKETILGVRHAHRPASVISLHPTSSSCQTPCKR